MEEQEKELSGGRIIQVDVEDQMKSSYIDYAMSVIVSRALPDVRDGLKPVHRRVLYGMQGLGLTHTQSTKKSARIVGEVLGKYHPHGDTSVYDTMVRMAQTWAMRYPLVLGQGNFGSVDGDSAAAMRYTEAKLSRISEDVLKDLEKETVDMMPNFDESLQEPTVLPTRIPLLLVNGSSGIAVGMATNMAPHNLGEVVDGLCAYIDNPSISIEELMQYVKGPDFPTGAAIYGMDGIRDAFMTGRGRIVIRSKAEIQETETGRSQIVVTEIPYQVNKEEMIRRIADMVNEKKLEGISYINDESSRKGMRIVIILKRDANPNVVLNHLYRHSQLQVSFSVNNIALVGGRPRLLNLHDMMRYFVLHRKDVVVRRSIFEKRKAEERMHILEGLLIALDHIDEVVSIIRASQTPAIAMESLEKRFSLSKIQSQSIVDMRLRALTGLEREKVEQEHAELTALIEYLTRLLADESVQYGVIKEELQEVKRKYADPRCTLIVPNADEFAPEDFYPDDDVVITMSHLGYIKRTNLNEYRAQHRGGKGMKGLSTREEDFTEYIYNCTMHNTLLFFTEKGRCYWLKGYDVPQGSRANRGRVIQNVIDMEVDDRVRAIVNVPDLQDEEFLRTHYIVMCMRSGLVKRTSLEEYSRPRRNGLNAVKIREDDALLDVQLTDGRCDIMLATKGGMCVRFPEGELRAVGRVSQGSIGMRFAEDDALVGMVCCTAEEARTLLVVSEYGYCKRTPLDEYRVTHRGGKGVKTLDVARAGEVVEIALVNEEDHLMVITRGGVIIRFPVEQVRELSRNTKGVQCIELAASDAIVSISPVAPEDEEGEMEGDEAGDAPEGNAAVGEEGRGEEG